MLTTKKKNLVVMDLDGTLVDPPYTDLYLDNLENYNKDINYDRLKRFEQEIKENPFSIEDKAVEIFHEYHKGGLTIWQHDEASFRAAEQSETIKGTFYGISSLYAHNYHSAILSAAGIEGVNYISARKVGLNIFHNEGTVLFFDDKGRFTGRYKFLVNKNRAIGLTNIIKKLYGFDLAEKVKENALRTIVIDDSPPSLPFLESMVNGWFIWVDDNKEGKSLITEIQEKYSNRIKLIQKPEIKENFADIVNELLKMERLESLSIPRFDKRQVYQIIYDLQKSQKSFMESNDINYYIRRNAFLNKLADLFSLDYFSAQKFRLDNKLAKLRLTNSFTEGRDISYDIINSINSLIDFL